MVAGGRDRTRRAQVEATRTAGDMRARMSTQIGGKIDVAELIEFPDETGGLGDRGSEAGAVSRIGPEIAGAQFVGRKQGSVARKVENYFRFR